MAAEKGYGSIVAYLIGHGARLETGADFDLTPIFLASQFGHSGCLKFMLKVAKEKGWSDRCVHKNFFLLNSILNWSDRCVHKKYSSVELIFWFVSLMCLQKMLFC